MPEPRILTTGLGIGESPRWHEGRLWFSNWGLQEVVAVDLEGRRRKYTVVGQLEGACGDGSGRDRLDRSPRNVVRGARDSSTEVVRTAIGRHPGPRHTQGV